MGSARRSGAFPAGAAEASAKVRNALPQGERRIDFNAGLCCGVCLKGAVPFVPRRPPKHRAVVLAAGPRQFSGAHRGARSLHAFSRAVPRSSPFLRCFRTFYGRASLSLHGLFLPPQFFLRVGERFFFRKWSGALRAFVPAVLRRAIFSKKLPFPPRRETKRNYLLPVSESAARRPLP